MPPVACIVLQGEENLNRHIVVGKHISCISNIALDLIWIFHIRVSGHLRRFCRILIGNARIEALVDVAVRNREMVIVAVRFYTVSITNRHSIIKAIPLNATADPSDFAKRHIIIDTISIQTMGAGILQAEIMKYCVCRIHHKIIPNCKLNTLEHLTRIARITAQI